MGSIPIDDVILRFVVAVGLGAAIGFEREARNKVAGLRTHALVAVGSALFTMAGAYGFADVAAGTPIDPARIAAQVASGIGFIGAGAIIRDGRSVHGVTTAATLWTAAAIGLGAGAGFVIGTVVATVTVLVVLVAFRLVSRLLARASGTTLDVQLSYERGHGTLGPVLHALEDHGTVERVRIHDEGDVDVPGRRHVTVELRTADRAEVDALVARLRGRPEIDDVDVA